MLHKKLFIIPVIGTALVLTTGVITNVSAHSDTYSTSLIQKLAAKFNLNETEVKAVFDADKTERQAQHQAKFVEHLNEAVKDGKLTENQKQLILSKKAELETMRNEKMSQIKDPSTLTESERETLKSQRKAEIQALKTWADQNGIDLKYLMSAKSHRGFKL